MKKLLALFLTLFLMYGCTVVEPDADKVAVLVDKPIFIGQGGVRDETIPTGRAYTYYSTNPTFYKITPWNIKESFEDLNTSDNFPVHFDVYVNLKIIPEKAPDLLKNFGPDDISGVGPTWYTNNISPVIRELVRNEMSKFTMVNLCVRGTELDKAQLNIEKNIRDFIAKKKIPVTLENLNFSKISPDKKVMDARVETATQEQRIATETNKVRAEGQRKLAETARAEADNAYRLGLGYTPTQFSELEKVKVCAESRNCTLILGNATPVINTGSDKDKPDIDNK